jgi:hypothetical protein
LEAAESSGEWVTSTRSSPPNTILGSEAGFEAGIWQLRRARPLEAESVALPSGGAVKVPTLEETLRVKGYLVVARNRMRDYLDVAALADTLGVEPAGRVLAGIDVYYTEKTGNDEAVSTALAQRLAAVEPRDQRALGDLAYYKGLKEKWRDWNAVRAVCRQVAKAMVLG